VAGLAFADWLQLLGSVGFIVSLAPQLVRTVRLRRAEDISPSFLIILLVSSFILLVYAALTNQWFFFASYSANILVWGTVLYFRFRPDPTRSRRA
jgi:uncharacterized protein with PQ loop repeat